ARSAMDVIRLDHTVADAHLDAILSPTIFSVRTGRRLFRGMVGLTETQSWQKAFRAVAEVSRALEQDGRPALQSVRTAADEAGRVATALRQEVDGLVGASRRIRTQATEIADRVAERARDLEVVLDILQEEVEDTALDVAAALRATRRGAGVFRSLKRAVLGRRR
ncbi:MAG TPA: hypothetical protein VNL18_05025, partial [Gemmatimonadales bacterium]|nr:hypothetical protein [Gemmatimonadales bacterium]